MNIKTIFAHNELDRIKRKTLKMHGKKNFWLFN